MSPRHAAATSAHVSVRREGGMLRCEASDDGRGGADPNSGTGILGLRDRAEAAGGTLSVVSPPGRGTVVAAAVPLDTELSHSARHVSPAWELLPCTRRHVTAMPSGPSAG